MLNFDFQSRRTQARAGMVEWNRIFRLFRFSGILGQPREVLPKFRNEIPENVCSIRSPTRNFRNFWSNGKRPSFRGKTQNNSKRDEQLRQSNSGGEVGGFDRVSRMNFKTCHLLFELLLTIRFHKLTHHVSLLAVKVFRRDAACLLYTSPSPRDAQ